MTNAHPQRVHVVDYSGANPLLIPVLPALVPPFFALQGAWLYFDGLAPHPLIQFLALGAVGVAMIFAIYLFLSYFPRAVVTVGIIAYMAGCYFWLASWFGLDEIWTVGATGAAGGVGYFLATYLMDRRTAWEETQNARA